MTVATPATVDVPAIPSNAPPSIVVAEIADAEVGARFDYQPVAQDPESDALRFTAVNLPAWASLDPASGRISGTPGPTDAGLYESISITVADATHKVVTAPFSIAVNPAVNPALEPALESGSGVASLQWEVPPSKVSGEPLDDLVGYRILYGRSSSDLDHSVMVPDPATTSFQISSLSSGVWYFAVVAVNSNGLEGPPTTLTSKSI
ncbi:MAG TPA: putative Ig domain-containing protein [Steroidobacteraceae bacterium]|nr:putative Ig domain-containing protein [Steroidobacteraceae bacterium]